MNPVAEGGCANISQAFVPGLVYFLFNCDFYATNQSVGIFIVDHQSMDLRRILKWAPQQTIHFQGLGS